MDTPAISFATDYGSIPEWDSIMHLRLIMEIQAHYCVDIPLEDVPGLTTVEKLYDKTMELVNRRPNF